MSLSQQLDVALGRTIKRKRKLVSPEPFVFSPYSIWWDGDYVLYRNCTPILRRKTFGRVAKRKAELDLKLNNK